MGSGGGYQSFKDFNVAALPPLEAPPAKTDIDAVSDTSDGGRVKGATQEQKMGVILDASVSHSALSGTSRFPIVTSGGTLEYGLLSDLATLAGSTSPGPLNNTGYLSGSQYTNGPESRIILPGTGVSTLYLNPLAGAICLYNGSGWTSYAFTSPLSLSLTGVTAGFYEVYLGYNGSALALELSTVWTDNYRKRSQAVTTQDGVAVKSGATSKRLVGMVYVFSTGLANWGGPWNGIIPVQYMWNPTNEHIWYGRHAGWHIPYATCMVLGNDFHNRPIQGVKVEYSTLRNEYSGVPGVAAAWSFRNPNRVLHINRNGSGSGYLHVKNPTAWTTDIYRNSDDFSFQASAISSYQAYHEYDPVNNWFYYPDVNNSDFYRNSLTSTGNSTQISSTNCLQFPTYNPIDGKVWGHRYDSSGNIGNYDPSGASWSTPISSTAHSPNGGFMKPMCHCPTNNKIYAAIGSSGQIKVIDPTGGSGAGTVSSTISLTGGYSGNNWASVFYIPFLDRIVVVGMKSATPYLRVWIINPNTDTEVGYLNNVVAPGGSGVWVYGADYVPGWGAIVCHIYDYNMTDYSILWIDCRNLDLLADTTMGNFRSEFTSQHYNFENSATSVPYRVRTNGCWYPGTNEYLTKASNGAEGSSAPATLKCYR